MGINFALKQGKGIHCFNLRLNANANIIINHHSTITIVCIVYNFN